MAITWPTTRISSVILHMASAPVTAGNIYIYTDMRVGSGSELVTSTPTFPALLHTNEMLGKTDLIWLPGWQLWAPIGDSLRVVYTNPDAITWFLRMVVEEWD